MTEYKSEFYELQTIHQRTVDKLTAAEEVVIALENCNRNLEQDNALLRAELDEILSIVGISKDPTIAFKPFSDEERQILKAVLEGSKEATS